MRRPRPPPARTRDSQQSQWHHYITTHEINKTPGPYCENMHAMYRRARGPAFRPSPQSVSPHRAATIGEHRTNETITVTPALVPAMRRSKSAVLSIAPAARPQLRESIDAALWWLVGVGGLMSRRAQRSRAKQRTSNATCGRLAPRLEASLQKHNIKVLPNGLGWDRFPHERRPHHDRQQHERRHGERNAEADVKVVHAKVVGLHLTGECLYVVCGR